MVYQCNDVILTLKKLEFVTDICGVGSYFDGRADRYSDIDFVVKVKDIYPDEALLRITHLLKRTYAPLWSDFANSLMPRKFWCPCLSAVKTHLPFWISVLRTSTKTFVIRRSVFKTISGCI